MTIAESVSYARAQVGKPYVWDTAGPQSFDCSGLVLAALRLDGVVLAHEAALQGAFFQGLKCLHPATRQWLRMMRPGDEVFYYGTSGDPASFTHCALYVGRGRFGRRRVVAAVDEYYGVRDHKINKFLRPTAVGFVKHD